MALDHYGRSIAIGNVIEVMPVSFFKIGLGWYRKITRIRKHGRRGTVTAVSPNGDLTFTGVDTASHLIKSHYVKKIS